jgi:hypothetical protein
MKHAILIVSISVLCGSLAYAGVGMRAPDIPTDILETPLAQILARFGRGSIKACSDRSSCNMLCSRVIGSLLRHPVSALMTPMSLKPLVPS